MNKSDAPYKYGLFGFGKLMDNRRISKGKLPGCAQHKFFGASIHTILTVFPHRKCGYLISIMKYLFFSLILQWCFEEFRLISNLFLFYRIRE